MLSDLIQLQSEVGKEELLPPNAPFSSGEMAEGPYVVQYGNPSSPQTFHLWKMVLTEG